MNNYGLGILIQAKDQASAVFQKVERNFDSLSKKSDEMASRMQASSKMFYAGIGMMGGGAALLGGVGATIKVAGDFEEAMIGVQKTTGMADAELKKLGDQFLTMSARMPNSARELANIGEIGGQLGITGVKNLSAFTDTVAKLASVSEFSAEEGGAARQRSSARSVDLLQSKPRCRLNHVDLPGVQFLGICDSPDWVFRTDVEIRIEEVPGDQTVGGPRLKHLYDQIAQRLTCPNNVRFFRNATRRRLFLSLDILGLVTLIRLCSAFHGRNSVQLDFK